MDVSIYSVSIWMSAIIIGSIGLVIYIGSNRITSKLFSFCMFWVSIWAVIVGFFISATNAEIALFIIRLSYFVGTLISSSFLYFFFVFPDDRNPNKYIAITLTFIELIYSYIFIYTPLIIKDVAVDMSANRWGWSFGELSFLFETTFFTFFIIGILILIGKYKKERKENVRKNLKFMILTIIIGSSIPSIISIVLPRFGIFYFDWLGPISQIIWIPILTYSILKYKQMDVRAVLIEAIAVVMTLLFFINIFLNVSTGIHLRIVIFIFFILLAIYILRTSIREAKQRDMLRDLNLNLAQKVEEQTQEVRKAYELEKKAKRELEKLNETKDQFIMITQHNLRTPVTTIRWEIESILNKKIDDAELRITLNDMLSSTHSLSRIIDDFLNITAIKAGANILNIKKGNLQPAIEGILQDLRIDIENMNLQITYPEDKNSWPELNADLNKLREVLFIIIENAIKYNFKDGKIEILTKTDGNIFEIEITNTGIGFTNEDRKNVFEKLFYRSKKSFSSHPTGMGIGLSVARAVVKAHHGEIEIHSEGENKGASVKIIIPVNFLDNLNLPK